MPTTNLGIYYPDAATNITPLQTVMASISTSVDAYLAANATVHTIANTAGRAALVAAYSPSVSNPLFVWRQDAAAGNNLEYTTNGTSWLAYGGKAPYFSTTAARDTALPSPVVGMHANTGSGSTYTEWAYDGSAWITTTYPDTGWVAVTNATGFDASGYTVRRVNGVVYARGTVVPTGSGTISTTFIPIFTLPTGFFPTSNLQPWPAGATIAAAPQAQVTTAGAVSVRTFLGSGAAYTTSSSFFVPGGWLTI